MRFLQQIADRSARSDMAQAFLLVLSILVLVLGFSWPSGGSLVNQSWFTFSPARNALLALAAALFGALQTLGRHVADEPTTAGSADHVAWLPEARTTLAALMVWVLVTLPIEVVSYAASYPAMSLVWAVLVSLLTVPAYFGLGMLLRSVANAARVEWVLPIIVPAVVVGLAWIDLHFGSSLLNPWSASLSVSGYPITMGVATLLTAVWLSVPHRLRVHRRRTAHGDAP